CGVFGFKPSRGRNPLGPDYNDPFLLVAEHVLTISVRDSAALLDATCGPMPGEPAALPRPERSFLEALATPGPRLRIAYTAAAPAGTPVHADAIAAVEDAARLSAGLGHHVEEARPEIDGARFYETFVQIWIDGCAAAVDAMMAVLGRERTLAGIEPFTRQLWERGQTRTAIAHLRARETLARVARQLGVFFERYDVWLTPTTGHPPPPLGHFGYLTDGADAVFARSQEFVPWTLLANTAGLPAMSVPLHWTATGLPMGAHFVGRAREDATLFRLARALEETRPWAARLPPA
ncbi:MAG: amidase, partial [Alphaproteobacteria bacterium]|nr:amidase [Alphaproteobacteria bacterium]